MSSGLLATVPSGSNGNGNGNGNAETSSDSMRFSETSRDAAAPSSKWHRDPLLLLWHFKLADVSWLPVYPLAVNSLKKTCLFFCLFLSLSDASSLPGRLAKWCHDVPAGGFANQRRHAPTGWGQTTSAPSLDYPLDAYRFPVCAVFTGAITGLYHWLSQFPVFFFYFLL